MLTCDVLVKTINRVHPIRFRDAHVINQGDKGFLVSHRPCGKRQRLVTHFDARSVTHITMERSGG